MTDDRLRDIMYKIEHLEALIMVLQMMTLNHETQIQVILKICGEGLYDIPPPVKGPGDG